MLFIPPSTCTGWKVTYRTGCQSVTGLTHTADRQTNQLIVTPTSSFQSSCNTSLACMCLDCGRKPTQRLWECSNSLFHIILRVKSPNLQKENSSLSFSGISSCVVLFSQTSIAKISGSDPSVDGISCIQHWKTPFKLNSIQYWVHIETHQQRRCCSYSIKRKERTNLQFSRRLFLQLKVKTVSPHCFFFAILPLSFGQFTAGALNCFCPGARIFQRHSGGGTLK